MSAYELAEILLRGVELTSGQAAQLRAADVMCQTRLFALRADAASDDADAQRRERVALAALENDVVARLRELLHDDQRAAFDVRVGEWRATRRG